MVWFYPADFPMTGTVYITFNPTMVWFYQIKDTITEFTAKLLSIPLWSDFIMYVIILQQYGEFQLSIPLWSDFIVQQNNHRCRHQPRLSIPLWSDFISLHLFVILYLCLSFNPTMVWFYPSFLSFTSLLFILLSIPLWSDFICTRLSKLASCKSAFNPTMVWFYLR